MFPTNKREISQTNIRGTPTSPRSHIVYKSFRENAEHVAGASQTGVQCSDIIFGDAHVRIRKLSYLLQYSCRDESGSEQPAFL